LPIIRRAENFPQKVGQSGQVEYRRRGNDAQALVYGLALRVVTGCCSERLAARRVRLDQRAPWQTAGVSGSGFTPESTTTAR
jgi:hypothetical protein